MITLLIKSNLQLQYRLLYRIFTTYLLAVGLLASCSQVFGNPSYTVVIDPGHGGAPTVRNDDMYDPVTQKYLNGYNMGMQYGKYHEYKIVLEIAKKTKKYLELTETSAGWTEFEKLLTEFSPQQEFKRITLSSHMSRTDNWSDTGLSVDDRNVNAPYRHYDFPDINNSKKMSMGRLSFINSLKPQLVVSIHLNPAGPKQSGGMAAVLAPGYRTFNQMRQITLGKAKPDAYRKLPWSCCWLRNQPGWSDYQVAMADTWVYFHGYWTNKNNTAPWLEKNRGFRHNMITWRYRDNPGWEAEAAKHGPGPYALKYDEFRPEGRFWDRERSDAELWRREAAVPGTSIKWGGDNHFASDELLRFLQYGLRQLSADMRKPNAMGGIVPPFVSTYGLPTYINAISAYLEIAHLNVARDRVMVLGKQDEIAKSLAVGIYSLFAGIELRKTYKGPFRPTGKPLDLEKYRSLATGDYFENVVD
mgnify:CR=1 FL=1